MSSPPERERPFSNGPRACAARRPSPPAHRLPAGFGFQQQRVDAARRRQHHPHRLGVEQYPRPAGQHQLVGRQLESGVVVGLRGDLAAEQGVRGVQAAQPVHARQQLVGQAMHHLLNLAEHVGVQATEIGHPGGRAHAAQKAVALHQQGAATGARGRRGRHDAGRAAAQHHHVVLAQHGGLAARFGQAGGRGGVGGVHVRMW